MANNLYNYNPSSYADDDGASATSLYGSRSITSSYHSPDIPLRGSSFRFLSAESLSAAGLNSSLFYYPDSYSKVTGSSATTTTKANPAAGVDLGSTVASIDSLYADLKRITSDSLYHQSGTNNTTVHTEGWYSTNFLTKRPKYESASPVPIYPQRPGEKDCSHYMQTRTCKFGESCKFDHPIWVPEGGLQDWKEVASVPSESLPDRPGEPDCPYFLKTQRCKFGVLCKFNHPKDIIAIQIAPGDTDHSILPERPSEPSCAFYMKTGNCKFGRTCKFHHPKGVQVTIDGEENGSVVQHRISGEGMLKQLYKPALSFNSKGLPIRLDGEDCPFYLKNDCCKFGVTCRYNHPERDAPTLLTSTSWHFDFGLGPKPTHTALGYGTSVYPQRPGQLECDHYMKTGTCKFGGNCKFHHPSDRIAIKFTLAGLPRREDAINCPYYMTTGACKYGATCKFDHPPPAEVMAMGKTEAAVDCEVEAKENEVED